MAEDNKQNGDKETAKYCPFLKAEWVGKKCALYKEMARNIVGIQQKFGECAFSAVVLLLSEMNQKTSISPMPSSLLKGLNRG